MTNPAPSPFTFVRRFNPVFTRDRHDGWKPAKQIAFINALAESGCVADACRRVGMSTESAYALKRRYDAIDFRLAWDAALDFAVQRLSDAALSRAIHGIPVPHYYKGEVVGEHRRYNETLTMFILRYRDPVTYAKSWDRRDVVRGHPEAEAERLAVGIENIGLDNSRRVCEENHAREQAAADAEDEVAMLNERREAAYQARIKAEEAAKAARAAAEMEAAAKAANADGTTARPGQAGSGAASETSETGNHDGLAGQSAAREFNDWGGVDPSEYGVDIDEVIAERIAAFHAGVAAERLVTGTAGAGSLVDDTADDLADDAQPDATADARLEANGDAFHSGVASGSSTSEARPSLVGPLETKFDAGSAAAAPPSSATAALAAESPVDAARRDHAATGKIDSPRGEQCFTRNNDLIPRTIMPLICKMKTI